MDFNDDIKFIIYDFIPYIFKKYCNKDSYQDYLKLFLPKSSDDWNMEIFLHKNYNSDMIKDFLKQKINNSVMHRIYLYVKKEKLENLFIDSYKYSEDLRDNYQKLFKVICDECNDDNNCYIALPHHYIII